MVNEDEAKEAYAEGRVRKLFAVEGYHAKKHYLSGEQLVEAFRRASNVNRCFVVWNDDNFGVYEIVERALAR